jgi:hypothetical protein
MKLILKMIEQIVDALAQILAPQMPVVTGNYLARRDAMRRWNNDKSIEFRNIVRRKNK